MAQAAMKVLYRQRQEEELKGKFFQEFPEARERFLRQDFTLIPCQRRPIVSTATIRTPAHCIAVVGRGRPADRLHERCESSARPRGCASKGDRHPGGLWEPAVGSWFGSSLWKA